MGTADKKMYKFGRAEGMLLQVVAPWAQVSIHVAAGGGMNWAYERVAYRPHPAVTRREGVVLCC